MTTGREKSRRSSREPVLVGFEDGGHRCPARSPSRHFAAPPVLTWATRPKQRGAQLSPRRPATHTGLACSNSEVPGRSGSTAPIDCVNRGAELRCVASSASKGRLLGRTGSLARAHASVLRSLGIRKSASPAEGWSGIGAVLLTVRAAAEGRIVSAVPQLVSAPSGGRASLHARLPWRRSLRARSGSVRLGRAWAATMEAKGLTNDALRALFLPSAPAAAAPAAAAPAAPTTAAADAAAAPERDGGGVVQEGLARLRTEGTFYNKKSVLQRDLTVLALRTWLHQRPAPAVVLDAMAGSGVRALRYLLEVPQVGTAVANDSSQLALAAIGTNALLSGLRPAGAQRYTASDGYP